MSTAITYSALDLMNDYYNVRYMQKFTGMEAPKKMRTSADVGENLRDIKQLQFYMQTLTDGAGRNIFSNEDIADLAQPVADYFADKKEFDVFEMICIRDACFLNLLHPGFKKETSETLELAAYRGSKSVDENVKAYAKNILFTVNMMEVANDIDNPEAAIDARMKLNLLFDDRDAAIEEYYPQAAAKYENK